MPTEIGKVSRWAGLCVCVYGDGGVGKGEYWYQDKSFRYIKIEMCPSYYNSLALTELPSLVPDYSDLLLRRPTRMIFLGVNLMTATQYLHSSMAIHWIKSKLLSTV